MSFDVERLYQLLPAIYRIRDAEQGEPLRELVSVIAEQAAVLEEDLAQLYDDQFIETCAEWVAPYIGELIGYRPLHGGRPNDATPIPRVASPRAEVAHTIAFRRRKGTATMLEQLAHDVTDWPTRVVEYFQLLATTQYMNHVRPGHLGMPDLRKWEPLERLGTAFESTARTVEARRIATEQGRYNIPNIGIFLWRLRALSVTQSPAVPVTPGDTQRFLFDPLGIDAPLFHSGQPEEEITHLAEPINVPEPISRRVLHQALASYYGHRSKKHPARSLFVRGSLHVHVCNLSDLPGPGSVPAWAHFPPTGVAIDPVLGRIAFPTAQGQPPLVSFHRGFSAEMGGGEYQRTATFEPGLEVVQSVTSPATIQTAISAATATSMDGAVQILDSGRYEETLKIKAKAGQRLEIRARDGSRPMLVLGGLEIEGGADSEVTLNGLLLAGAAVVVGAQPGKRLRKLRLVHCTLVPGLTLLRNGLPKSATEPSLIVKLANLEVEIDHCIVGGVQITELSRVSIRDSIVDATAPGGVAYAAPGLGPGGPLRIENSTVIGQVRAFSIELASNSIFHATAISPDVPLRSKKRQTGCMRFCYVPIGARVPSRYRCQPETALAERAAELGLKGPADLPASEVAAVRARLAPAFNSLQYGQPTYAQLAARCPVEIRQGASDEAEMGAFHDLFQPQRETNLRVRLDEYLRFGHEAGIFYAT